MYFYVSNLDPQAVSGESASHLLSMRVAEGGVVNITNLNGIIQKIKITSVEKKKKEVKWQVLGKEKKPNQKKNILFQAITDKAYLEKMVEVLAFSNVRKVYLFESDNSIKNQKINLERLQKIIIRSSEQSEQTHKLEIKVINSSELEKLIKEQQPLVLDCYIQDTDKNPAQKSNKEGSVMVGPEGGWTDSERRYFAKIGLLPSSLGDIVYPAWIAGFVYFTSLNSSQKVNKKLNNLGWSFEL